MVVDHEHGKDDAVIENLRREVKRLHVTLEAKTSGQRLYLQSSQSFVPWTVAATELSGSVGFVVVFEVRVLEGLSE